MRVLKFRIYVPIVSAMYYFTVGDSTIPITNTDIQQFTGLHDKNGKEIYEGDIIQIAYDQTCIGQVVYEDGRFTATEFVNSSYLGQDDVESMGIEVIGNIHENPELLESK